MGKIHWHVTTFLTTGTLGILRFGISWEMSCISQLQRWHWIPAWETYCSTTQEFHPATMFECRMVWTGWSWPSEITSSSLNVISLSFLNPPLTCIRRLRFLTPVAPYKTSFVYNNLMYGLISRLTEVIGGNSWEDLMDEKIFQPLGMTSSTFTHLTDLRSSRVAQPYLREPTEGQWRNVSLLLHR